ncbi:MAG: hypothetical protein KA715_12800 [Xanthomonadaceae bacterium]|nr:hypothetical protein [Xanthomonadaceae bacterium]
MPKNKRFVSVKSPMDFFTPEELKKIEVMTNFYVPDFVEHVVPYRSTGRSIRSLLTYQVGENELGPTPFELSDSILRLVAPLWRSGWKVDPFFVSVLVNELFEPLPEAVLNQARDENVDQFERSLYQSSITVFLALHLGYTDLKELGKIRTRVFALSSANRAVGELKTELEELIACVQSLCTESTQCTLDFDQLEKAPGITFQRLKFRLKRIREELNKAPQDFVSFKSLLEEEIKVNELTATA